MKKVLISTLGCKVNQADSEALAAGYLSKGFELAGTGDTPDICIINTCTVTSKADAQCRNEIRRLRRRYPGAKVIVTGCYANTSAEEIGKMPEVDQVVRTGDTHYLDHYHGSGACPRFKSRPQVKVQDGCDRFCAYCIVPYARGRSRSVPKDEALRRITELAVAGYPEVVLTGVDLGSYGADLRPASSLSELLRSAAASLGAAGKNFRIRLSSVEPDEFTPELVELISGSGLICPHLHIPLQSGDDEILRAMGRRYTTEDYRRVVELLTSRFLPPASANRDTKEGPGSGICIGTDVIVGFPGETREHFERTMEFIESLRVAYLHVFPFSKRRLTGAAGMKETVTPSEKKRRVAELRRISAVKREAYYRSQLGRDLDVVIDGGRDKRTGLLKGISGNYVPVLIDGPDELTGRMVTARIERVNGGFAYGGRL